MDSIILSLGSNLGERFKNLQQAQQFLQERGISIMKASKIYETEPFHHHDQPWFLNQVLIIETEKTPEELLTTCLEIEKKMGRVRKEKYGPRIMDIDILYFHNEKRNMKALKLPHPEISKRKFVLVPLSELMPEAKKLLDECQDCLRVKPYQQP